MVCVAIAAVVAAYATGRAAAQGTSGKTFVSPGGTQLKVLVDGFAKKVQASGFTVDEALVALQPYTAATRRKSNQAGSSAPVLYRDPSNPENTWSGRGRAAKWISDYEAAGRSRDEFKV